MAKQTAEMTGLRRRKRRSTGMVTALRLAIAAGALMGGLESHAQITLDGSLTGTPRDLTGPNFRIEAADGKIAGGNRFHSFGQFNLSSLESANFTNSPGIRNILSRVTGGNVSNIDGALISETAGANFFFMNPNGVIFGPNASLDVGGAFTVTTADKLKLKDGAVFLATPGPADFNLTSADVASFGFLGPGAPAPVIFDGSRLSTQPGKSFSVIAGDVTLKNGAEIAAPGGNVSVVSVASPGTVGLDVADPLGEVTIQNGSAMGEVSVTDSRIDASDTGVGGGGGRVLIRGGKLMIERSQVLSKGTANSPGGEIEIAGDDVTVGADSTVDTSGEAGGGWVRIAGTDTVRVENSQVLSKGTGTAQSAGGEIQVTGDTVTIAAGSTLDTSGQAGGGEIHVGGGLQGNDPDIPNATTTTVETGAILRADALQSGDAGTIVVWADGTTRFDGILSARALGPTGGGGFAEVSGKREVYLPDIAGQIDLSTAGGHPGTLLIDPVNVTVKHGTGGGIAGTAITDGAISDALKSMNVTISTSGDITLKGLKHPKGPAEISWTKPTSLTLDAGDDFIMNIGSKITAESKTGNAGSIAIDAGGNVTLDGSPRVDTVISTSSRGSGKAGSLTISTAGTLTIGRRGQVKAKAFNIGSGGKINITAHDIRLFGRGSFAAISASSRSTGNGGIVKIKATGTITLVKGGRITAEAEGFGAGGNIDISANEIRMDGRGVQDITIISASSREGAKGGSGNVDIDVAETFQIADKAEVRARGVSEGVNAGNVRIAAGEILLEKNAKIVSNGVENGGNVTIRVRGDLVADETSDISADAGSDGGNVTINFHGGNLVVEGNSSISAEARSGEGGRVTIAGATGFEVGGGGMITANSVRGDEGGDVTLRLNGGDVVFTGKDSGLMAEAGKGDGGNLSITGADSIRLEQGAQLSADAAGDGGDFTLETRGGDIMLKRESKISANAEEGNGGNFILNLNGGVLSLNETSQLTANSLVGNGGNITVNNAGAVDVSRHSSITADAGGSGGNIDLAFVNGGDLSVIGESRISANAERGDGGDIALTLKGGELSLADHSAITANATIGNGGNVRIDGAGSAELTRNSAVTADAGRDGGDVSVDVGGGDLNLFSGSRISANAKNRDGGNVSVRGGAMTLDGHASISADAGRDGGDVDVLFGNDGLLLMTDGSFITANAQRNGGNLTVIGAPGSGVILDDSAITANAIDGRGGNIDIAADFLLANDSPITASSEKGTDGIVNLDVKFDLTGTETRLPGDVVDDDEVEEGLDPSKVPKDHSTFISGGRGGVPIDPTGYLPSMKLWDLPDEEQ